MKSMLSLSLFFIFTFLTEGSYEKKEIYKLEKPQNAFSATGTQSYVRGTGYGPNASTFPAKVELKDLDDGFLIRNEAHLIYFDDDFNKVWEKDLHTEYKLGPVPFSVLKGNKDIAYFIEVRTNPFNSNTIYVNSVDRSGHHNHKEIYLGKEMNMTFTGMSRIYSKHESSKNYFINSKNELCILVVYKDRKADRFQYKIQKLDAQLNLTEQVVALPVDGYELSKKTGFSVDNLPYFWTVLGKNGKNALLVKTYFKDIEEKKEKSLVLETVELTPENNLVNHKKWPFDAYIIDKDRKFVVPSVAFEEEHQEIYLVGYIAIGNKNLNGSYLIKYDYTSQNRIYKKEYTLKELTKDKKPEHTVHLEIPQRVDAIIPLNLSYKDISLSQTNRTVTVSYISNVVAAAKWNSTYLTSTFDQYGDLVETKIIGYNSSYYGYDNNVKTFPVFIEELYKDFDRAHLKNVGTCRESFESKNILQNQKEEKYYIFMERKDKALAVIYDEDNGTCSGISIND